MSSLQRTIQPKPWIYAWNLKPSRTRQRCTLSIPVLFPVKRSEACSQVWPSYLQSILCEITGMWTIALVTVAPHVFLPRLKNCGKAPVHYWIRTSGAEIAACYAWSGCDPFFLIFMYYDWLESTLYRCWLATLVAAWKKAVGTAKATNLEYLIDWACNHEDKLWRR